MRPNYSSSAESALLTICDTNLVEIGVAINFLFAVAGLNQSNRYKASFVRHAITFLNVQSCEFNFGGFSLVSCLLVFVEFLFDGVWLFLVLVICVYFMYICTACLLLCLVSFFKATVKQSEVIFELKKPFS